MKCNNVILGLCLFFLQACGAMRQAHLPVPPIQAERVPAPPKSSAVLIWQPGHYDWNGVDYVWIPGEWIERAGRGTLWQDGYWQQINQTSVWVPAHWL